MRSGSQIHIKIGLFSFFLGSLFSCQTNPKQMEELSKFVGYDVRMISPDFGNA